MTHARYEQVVEQHFSVTSRSGSEFMCNCIWHDDSSSSLQINVESGLYLCFSCDARGNSKTLLRELGLRYTEQEVDVSDLRARIDTLREPHADPLPALPESYLKRFDIRTPMWGDRGILPPAQAVFDLGYDPIENFLTIPIRNIQGQLLGVIRRYMDEDIAKNERYRYPKGFKRSQNLYGSWMVEHDPDANAVALVEGPLDSIPIWQVSFPALATYGSSISPSQIRVLRRPGIGRVILFFDDDSAGRKATRSCLGEHLHNRRGKIITEYRPETDLRREFIVDKVIWPTRPYKGVDGRSAHDPGALKQTSIKEMLRKARRVF